MKITHLIAFASNCNTKEVKIIQERMVGPKSQNRTGLYCLIKQNLLLILILSISYTLFQSCGNSVKDKGVVTIKNGKNEDISIPYEFSNFKPNTIDKQIFTSIITEIVSSTKNHLLYPLSFVPSNIIFNIYTETDLKYYATKMSVGKAISVKSTIYYTAKNGFGNELDGKNEDFFYVINGSIDREMPKKIELTPLVLKGGSDFSYVNRELFAANENYEFIQISPYINIHKDGINLNVKSALEDGGYGTTLIFSFSYGEKAYGKDLVLVSNTGSNEDKSRSYYDLTKEQIEVLKNNKLGGILIKHYPNSFYCSVDENLETYFIEYFSLKEVEKILQAGK